mmetsp:Transcript_3900/g.4496  ORF Transcript_3900/g.4496 Transcript_3900/m.4496 type:complete len:236 (+) Transcript_3900:229-936(+)|eukprot:CAMPEP_0184020458 /NCGR_PEP_ID=MMETSP0954-20121128/9360_1 /TAXON_ID=627963 /ORGANISM="Aplanochytrium sp, Strain PBS07" /LENGTH=235 /DNA_ID=CAMNT_0026302321 /DNA_START=226 /DNA_END=933 /DNA_ORIENTATION=-
MDFAENEAVALPPPPPLPSASAKRDSLLDMEGTRVRDTTPSILLIDTGDDLAARLRLPSVLNDGESDIEQLNSIEANLKADFPEGDDYPDEANADNENVKIVLQKTRQRNLHDTKKKEEDSDSSGRSSVPLRLSGMLKNGIQKVKSVAQNSHVFNGEEGENKVVKGLNNIGKKLKTTLKKIGEEGESLREHLPQFRKHKDEIPPPPPVFKITATTGKKQAAKKEKPSLVSRFRAK